MTPNHPKFFLLTIAYIFIGLALISTGFTVLQQVLQVGVTIQHTLVNALIGWLVGESQSIDSDWLVGWSEPMCWPHSFSDLALAIYPQVNSTMTLV